jgi:hypothetical protein
MTPPQAVQHLRRNLVGSDRAALDIVLADLEWQTDLAEQLAAQVAAHRHLQTLGGPPPAYNDQTWKNKRLPGGVHADYRGLA